MCPSLVTACQAPLSLWNYWCYTNLLSFVFFSTTATTTMAPDFLLGLTYLLTNLVVVVVVVIVVVLLLLLRRLLVLLLILLLIAVSRLLTEDDAERFTYHKPLFVVSKSFRPMMLYIGRVKDLLTCQNSGCSSWQCSLSEILT